MCIQLFLLATSILMLSAPAEAQIRVNGSAAQIDGSNITITPPGVGSSFIGKDPETGDNIMRITPPPRQQQQQPAIPYIVPQVDVPWQPQTPRPPIVIPPGYVPPGGIYPPGTFPPGNYPPQYPPSGNYPPQYPPSGNYPPGNYPPHYPVPLGR